MFDSDLFLKIIDFGESVIDPGNTMYENETLRGSAGGNHRTSIKTSGIWSDGSSVFFK